MDNCFELWRDRWTDLARYQGSTLPDAELRIHAVLDLWQQPIPGSWARNQDTRLLGARCQRNHHSSLPRGEHAIEQSVLATNFHAITCLGHRLIDGVNALPLIRNNTARGGRRANVEADMLLLGARGDVHRLFLCEVKVSSNNVWYATLENLRQLKLFLSSPTASGIFSHRNLSLHLPSTIPVAGLVLAPLAFYRSRGQKINALKHTRELLTRLAPLLPPGVEAGLAVWQSFPRLEITPLQD